MHVSVYEEVREVSNLLELELQTAMSCLMWVLGIEPRSPARTVCAYVLLAPELAVQPLY